MLLRSAAGGVHASDYVTELHSQADLDRFVRQQDDSVLTVINVSVSNAAPCIHIFPAVLALARSFKGFAAFGRCVVWWSWVGSGEHISWRRAVPAVSTATPSTGSEPLLLRENPNLKTSDVTCTPRPSLLLLSAAPRPHTHEHPPACLQADG